MNWFRIYIRLVIAVVSQCFAMAAYSTEGFSLEDKPTEYLEVRLDGRVIAQYMYGYDTSTRARHQETYKPYLHVFDSEGKAPITKGAGGQFTHHRGIFIGWNKIRFGGKTHDRWHMRGGDIVHQKFLCQHADKDSAAFTSQTFWESTKGGKPMIVEERTITFHRLSAPARLRIDFITRLEAPQGDVTLDGDPEHAGVHFRPASQIVLGKTKYVFPKERAEATKDLDYPWVGESFSLNEARYSVVHMNHPDNPKQTRYSAYRDYGRFGAFPKATIKQGTSLTLKYRFAIIDGEMPDASAIQKVWDSFADVKVPTPTPVITVKDSDKSLQK